MSEKVTDSLNFWPPAADLRRAEVRVGFRGENYARSLVAPPAVVGPRSLVIVVHNFQGRKFFDDHVAEYQAPRFPLERLLEKIRLIR